MSDLDVLIIGGYSPSDSSAGGSPTRDQIRLSYKNQFVTLEFIKHLVKSSGNLKLTEQLCMASNQAKMVSRSLNTIYLYDFLTENGINAKAINYFLLEQDKFKKAIQQKPKVVVISTTFIYDPSEINLIAKSVKDFSPDSIIIAGGIKILKSFKKFNLFNEGYFTDFDINTMQKSNFFFDYEIDKFIDVFIIEENGELTLLEVVSKIKNGKDFKDTPNISYRDKQKLIFTNRKPEPFTFEKRLISWDKIPKDIIGNEIPVRTGLGCPFKCAFCDFTGLHKVRIRTIDHVIEELRLIQKTFPGMPIFFTDDNLFTNKQRTKDLSEAIVKNNLKFKWRAFFRVDAISEDNVGILAKSGCMVAYLGIESGDNTILKNMNKRATREQNLKTVQLLNGNGISTISTIIIGFPGETRDTVNNTINLLNSYPDIKLSINKYYPFVFMLFPLSPIASPENRKKFDIKGGYENWGHCTMDSNQAKEEFLRCFKEVNIPSVAYLEFIDPEIPITKISDVSRERDMLVKADIKNINDQNINVVFKKFKNIIYT